MLDDARTGGATPDRDDVVPPPLDPDAARPAAELSPEVAELRRAWLDAKARYARSVGDIALFARRSLGASDATELRLAEVTSARAPRNNVYTHPIAAPQPRRRDRVRVDVLEHVVSLWR